MKIKTAELEGAALDWAVAFAVCPQGFKDSISLDTGLPYWSEGWLSRGSPSKEWSQGGPLIKEYGIGFLPPCKTEPSYSAWIEGATGIIKGESHLVAAMRAIVAALLGSEIDVPEELLR